jgi:predicted metal-dependent enzyme (double-stranded beta helix superfamily)
MTHGIDSAFEPVRAEIDQAVGAGDTDRIAQEVKRVLQQSLRCNALSLPSRFHTPRPDTYARRLLHRDPSGRYTVVVMTWGPQQGTALHDHAGIWCVECVVAGEMAVTQYDLVSEENGAYRFEEQNRVVASRGAAGCLIPPFEYHTLANARPDATSVTLHVYGGEMDHCHIFEPSGIGVFRRVTRALQYHD